MLEVKNKKKIEKEEMEILREGEGPSSPAIYDMMCFRQFGGCSTSFRFSDADVVKETKTTYNYHGDPYDSSSMHVKCPKCNREINLSFPGIKGVHMPYKN